MVQILDTTLREGEQTPYVNFTVDEKVHIAQMLDRIGVDMIEAGDPSVSNNVAAAIKRISALGLKAEIVAHSIASRSGMDGTGVPDPAASKRRPQVDAQVDRRTARQARSVFPTGEDKGAREDRGDGAVAGCL